MVKGCTRGTGKASISIEDRGEQQWGRLPKTRVRQDKEAGSSKGGRKIKRVNHTRKQKKDPKKKREKAQDGRGWVALAKGTSIGHARPPDQGHC